MAFPIAGVTADPWLLVLTGLAAGTCTGFLGIGGAFLTTPALNLLGFPMAYAIGTDLAHVMGKSVLATALHRRLGNVDGRAALLMVLGSVPGVELGARAVLALEGAGLAGGAVRWAYAALLAAVGVLMARDALRPAGRQGGVPRAGGAIPGGPGRLAAAVRALPWRPLLSLPASGIPAISAWVVLGVGLATGFLAGFLGVGGGFVRIPALLYAVGMPVRVAVGTDLLEVLVSSTYGTVTYALKGRVDVVAALLMLAGALVGSQIGVLATCYTSGRLRLHFALALLLTAVAVVLGQVGLPGAATALLFATAGALSLAIAGVLVAGLRRRPPHR